MVAQLPTREDYFQIGASEILSRSAQRPFGQRISRAALFTEGTDINIIIAACSAMADEGTRHLALRMAALYLDSAEEEDLDRLVADRFSPTVVRKRPARSIVDLQFTRPIPPSVGAPITYNIGHKFSTDTGVEFTLTQVASLGLGSTGPVVARAQAVLAGTSGNADKNTITKVLGANPDASVVVTNLEPASGGRDMESDASLRNRAREAFDALRRATLSAIEFGALTVEGVESASAFEETDQYGTPTGRIYLTIADSTGRSNQAMVEAVSIVLREWRAAGIIVTIFASTPAFQDIWYEIGFRDNIDQRSAINQLKALTVNAVNLLQPGETLERAMLFALARSVPGLIVKDAAVIMPLGDIYISPNETIKTSFDRVKINGM